MKIAIVGSGAIGLYYGAMLERSGQEVNFLMRSDLEAAKRDGIRILQPGEEFRIENPRVSATTAEIGVCDLVIVALKATANDSLAKLLPPLVGEQTQLLTLQNGLGNDGLLARLFPDNRIFGALCFVCLNRIAPAVAENFRPGSVSIGPRNPDDIEAAQTLVDVFQNAGVKTRLESNLQRVQWKKLGWNVPFNGLSIAAGGVTTDVIVESPLLTNEVRSLIAEIIAAAKSLGHPINDSFIDYQIELTQSMGAYRPSSMIDFVEGKPVEVEAIWGEALRRGKAAGVEMPKLEMLYALLKTVCAN